MIVVKLGGSLFEHRNLRIGLNSWLSSLNGPVILLPGGGPFADSVREFDQRHAVGEEASHMAALLAMRVTSELIRALVPLRSIHFLDIVAFCREHDQLPHSWAVTSDSLAVWVAIVRNADRVILLKSQDRPEGTWQSAADCGFVDDHFPHIANRAPMPIEVVNFRDWLDRGART
jgi:5-(aminomethyl)-3-furanmethanol phosphate kinase